MAPCNCTQLSRPQSYFLSSHFPFSPTNQPPLNSSTTCESASQSTAFLAALAALAALFTGFLSSNNNRELAAAVSQDTGQYPPPCTHSAAVGLSVGTGPAGPRAALGPWVRRPTPMWLSCSGAWLPPTPPRTPAAVWAEGEGWPQSFETKRKSFRPSSRQTWSPWMARGIVVGVGGGDRPRGPRPYPARPSSGPAWAAGAAGARG